MTFSVPADDMYKGGLVAFAQQFLLAGGTDILALEGNDLLGTAAEDAGRLVLAKNDRLAVNVDLYRITKLDVEGTAQLDGKNDATQFVYFSYNTCRFHISITFPYFT